MDGSFAIVLTLLTSFVFVAVACLYLASTHSVSRRQSVEGDVVGRSSVGGMLAPAMLVASVMGVWILFSPAETGTWAESVGLIGYSPGSAAAVAALVLVFCGLHNRLLSVALGASTVVALVGARLPGSPRGRSGFDFVPLVSRVRAMSD